MHRWNDHLRPIDLTEIDKQAHKAAIEWILGKYEEQESGEPLDWRCMIEHNLFSFLKRTVLTDLKPQLFHRIEEEKFDEVNDFVISSIKNEVADIDPEFFGRFERYLRSKEETKEDRIISAAHYLATNWEFNIIYDMNKRSFGIEQTKAALMMQLGQYSDMAGVKNILGSQTMTFIDLVGQLRFQQRWTRMPRIPATTVLGHSLMVAIMAFLNDLDKKVDDRQLYNDYFTALFHDLPEVLTKDVITPVKINVSGLVDILDEYEHELMNSKILPLIPEAWHEEFKFLTFEPFVNKDDPVFGKVNGKDIKLCDVMGAYLEAYVSSRYGVGSNKLKESEKNLYNRLKTEGRSIGANMLLRRLNDMDI